LIAVCDERLNVSARCFTHHTRDCGNQRIGREVLPLTNNVRHSNDTGAQAPKGEDQSLA